MLDKECNLWRSIKGVDYDGTLVNNFQVLAMLQSKQMCTNEDGWTLFYCVWGKPGIMCPNCWQKKLRVEFNPLMKQDNAKLPHFAWNPLFYLNMLTY